MRRKTHEEFVEELAEVGPNIEVLGTYENANTKIVVRCRVCGCEWSATPGNLLNGRSCPECAGNRRKTNEEFIAELAEVSPGIEVLGAYKSVNTPVAVRCGRCGCEWSATPGNLLKGTGCPECARAKTRKTHAQFVAELAEVSPDIEVLGAYVNGKTPVAVRCRTCGHGWSPTSGSLLRGSGCPQCARARGGRKPKAHNQFVEELAEANPGIEVLGTYENANTKIAVRCRTCGCEWFAAPNDLLRGSGCPECARAKTRKTHEEFLSEMAEKSPTIEVLGTYEENKKPVAVRCRTCGCGWSPTPNSLLNGHGCPKCAESRVGMAKRKTHARFVAELAERSPEIEVLGQYENNRTPVAVRCRACGHGWSARAGNLLRGQSCPECARARQRERGMEARIRRMAADGMVSEDDIALLRGWGFPFSGGELEKERR